MASSVLPKMAPKARVQLTRKKTKVEQKRQGRIQKRQIVNQINKPIKENIILTVLAEAESIEAYKRKRFAMSFEQPFTPKRIKSHSLSEQNTTWNHEEAKQLLSSHPVGTKINWSLSARLLHIPGKNAG